MSDSTVYRKIGDSTIHSIGFGVMGISTWYGAIDSDEERFKVLDAAYDSGCRHWDTSNVYGDSEDLIGKWFKRTGKRNEIFLATKFGGGAQIRGDPEYVDECIEKSLSRLGVDYVDLFYAHRIDSKIPIEVTVRALKKLVEQGKVKYLGLSECSATTLRRANAIHPISAVQLEVSPFVLDIFQPEIGLADACKEIGSTIVAYSPLGRGLLTGRYRSPDDFEEDDWRRHVPKFSRENFPKILQLVSSLEEIGKKHNATAGQVTLAWILALLPNIVVIPGTKKAKYLLENMGAAQVKLSKEEVEAVTKLAKEAEIPGNRYPDAYMASTFGDTPEEK
ncbi:Aldo/keto reductase [Pluteus cervinus]|uniref:Aldo/keto reductase n=1 Tax=Pluteus cervinus TaxID=181527 RepID=A0ACD3AKG7_9AGAR|nr:Aldo/keto reductase [Pluteus cervinus]